MCCCIVLHRRPQWKARVSHNEAQEAAGAPPSAPRLAVPPMLPACPRGPQRHAGLVLAFGEHVAWRQQPCSSPRGPQAAVHARATGSPDRPWRCRQGCELRRGLAPAPPSPSLVLSGACCPRCDPARPSLALRCTSQAPPRRLAPAADPAPLPFADGAAVHPTRRRSVPPCCCWWRA